MEVRRPISRALAGAAPVLLASLFWTAPAFAGGGFVANLVTPPVRLDGGNASTGGANDSLALPQCDTTPAISGLTLCVGGGNDGALQCLDAADCTPTCDGLGDACTSNADCNAGPCISGACAVGVCTNNFLGNHGDTCVSDGGCTGGAGSCRPAGASDGITAHDTPTLGHALNGLKSTCSVSSTAVAAAVTFQSNTVGTPLGVSGCSTDADCGGALGSCVTVGSAKECVGHCQGGHICNNTGPKATNLCLAGANKGSPCQSDPDCACGKNADCGKDSNGFAGTCIDGNEYILSVSGIIGSNEDGSPPCSGDCRVGSGGACVKGHCVGGPNEGASCSGFANCNNPGADCLAGRCSNGQSICQDDSQCTGGTCLLPPVTLTGDEVGFNFGAVKAFLLCPLSFRLDFPVEFKNGKGAVKTDVAKTALGVVVPSGVTASVNRCELHEPGMSNITELGLFTGTVAEFSDSYASEPCPGLLLPLPGQNLGMPINSGHGPIIGISGSQQK